MESEYPMIFVGKESFTWITEIPKSGKGGFRSEPYDMNGLENSKLTFSLKVEELPFRELSMTLQKTNIHPIRAKINVCFVEHKIQKNGCTKMWSSWMTCHTFPMDLFNDIEGMVNIFIEITWLNPKTSLHEPEPSNLYYGIKKFFDDSTFIDATIVVQNEEIKVHKIMICSYSSVFYDMFTNPMKEGRENKVEITDFKLDTVKIILKFIYTGDYEDMDDIDTALDVLAFAQKYNMMELKYICEYLLSRFVALDNVLKILNEADDNCAEALEKKCLEFMSEERQFIKSHVQHDMEKLCKAKPVLMYKFLMRVL